MALLKLQNFGGMIPVQGDRNIPDTAATLATNTWLYSGELRGVHPRTLLTGVISTTQKVFRIPLGTVGGDPANPSLVPPPSYLGDSVYLRFLDPDTDIIRGPLVNDSYKRFYFCSPSTGPIFNTYARLLTGDPAYKLGVPAPVGALGGSVTGGVLLVNVTRAYVYTNTNIYGEESAPSAPITIAGKDDGSWDITGIDDPTTEFTGFAPFGHKTLYRTITATNGATTYFMVATIASGTTTYSDTLLDTDIVNNLQLDSASWALPDPAMEGFISMPNGFLIGWKGSNLYFSEPYNIHAWPAQYDESTEYPIVGLGVYGQTCAVLTQGFPYTVTGTTPATCTTNKSTVLEPCLSRGGILSTPSGVYYPSQNGLMAATQDGLANITQQLITKEEWTKKYNPQYLRCARYQQGYLALRALPSGTRSAFYLDLTDLRVAVTELSDFDVAKNIHGDVWSGEVFVITGSNVYQHDPSISTSFMPFIWRSKEFQYLTQANFGVYSIYWDDARADISSGFGTGIMGATEKVRFKVYANRVLVYNQVVPTNGVAVRLPTGFTSDIWQFEIRGRAPVYTLHVASTMTELKGA